MRTGPDLYQAVTAIAQPRETTVAIASMDPTGAFDAGTIARGLATGLLRYASGGIWTEVGTVGGLTPIASTGLEA